MLFLFEFASTGTVPFVPSPPSVGTAWDGIVAVPDVALAGWTASSAATGLWGPTLIPTAQWNAVGRVTDTWGDTSVRRYPPVWQQFRGFASSTESTGVDLRPVARVVYPMVATSDRPAVASGREA